MLASVTALIRYRLERPEWSMADTSQLPQPLMDALFAFFEEERQAGQNDTAAPPSEEEIIKAAAGDWKPSRIDWPALFWALVKAFPGQFHRSTFASEKVVVVMAAQRNLLELQRQELQLQELQGAQLC